MLVIFKAWFGGNSSFANGNWVTKGMKRMQFNYFGWMFFSENESVTCRLVTTRRVDAFLLDIVMGFCKNRAHRQKDVAAVCIHFRAFLHGGVTTSQAKSTSKLCEDCKIPEHIFQEKEKDARDLVVSAKKEYRQYKKMVQSILKGGVFSPENCIPPYQVVGFFLGDGGVHVIWGTHSMTTTLTWTGDRKSAHALEFYSWSLFRDGIHRKAWKSKKRDVSRLLLNGVDNFTNHICPFFEEYPVPECEKGKLLVAVLEASMLLQTLKNKPKWTASDFQKLSNMIHQTWNLNTSGPSRKFGTAEQYIAHVKEHYKKKGHFRIA